MLIRIEVTIIFVQRRSDRISSVSRACTDSSTFEHLEESNRRSQCKEVFDTAYQRSVQFLQHSTKGDIRKVKWRQFILCQHDPRVTGLPTEDIKDNCRSQRMSH